MDFDAVINAHHYLTLVLNA